MAGYVFISHSSQDDAFVAELRAALAEDPALPYDFAAEVELLLEALGPGEAGAP
jgi:hypothetical protein